MNFNTIQAIKLKKSMQLGKQIAKVATTFYDYFWINAEKN
jgi:hypothetical protein